VDPQGNKVILSLRVPLPRVGGAAAMNLGGINDEGLVRTEIENVGP